MEEKNELSLKISGSGNREQIITSLRAIANILEVADLDEILSKGFQYEDPTLFAEANEADGEE